MWFFPKRLFDLLAVSTALFSLGLIILYYEDSILLSTLINVEFFTLEIKSFPRWLDRTRIILGPLWALRSIPLFFSGSLHSLRFFLYMLVSVNIQLKTWRGLSKYQELFLWEALFSPVLCPMNSSCLSFCYLLLFPKLWEINRHYLGNPWTV